MERPKVSIIIPVYNVEAFLPRCLDSVVGQTLHAIEIICVDDESPDNSLTILRDYAARDSRIRVISQKNKRQGGARNTGFDVASGEFVAFVDSDDWIDPEFCEKLYEAAVQHGADIACAGMSKHRPSRTRWTVRFDREEVCDDIQRKFDVCNCPPDFYIMNKLYRREALLGIGLRFREHVVYEDVNYVMRSLCETNRLVTVPGPCYRYIAHGGSTTKSSQTVQKQRNKYDAHREFVAYADAHGLRLAPRYRAVTKRFWALGSVTLFKLRECDGVLTGLLFDAIPVWRKKVKN